MSLHVQKTRTLSSLLSGSRASQRWHWYVFWGMSYATINKNRKVMTMFLATSQYIFSWGPFHPTSGEIWYALLGVLIGVLVGVHMATPRYMRRRE
jgi:hypothetical protein